MNAIVDQKATTESIVSFIKTVVPMPEQQKGGIDTSDVCLLDYRADDSDIASVCGDGFNWQRIRLIDDAGQVVPNARLELTFRTGKKVSIVPFFPLILLAKQATLKIGNESAMTQWAAQGSMKARNSHRFIMSKEQLEAAAAKAQMNYDIRIKELSDNFITWCGEYAPTVAQLPVLWECFMVRAILVVLGDSVYIRQTIPAKDTETQPLENPALEQANKPTQDTIGKEVISTAYTFKLLPVEAVEETEEAA
jgi:hypothetical protein